MSNHFFLLFGKFQDANRKCDLWYLLQYLLGVRRKQEKTLWFKCSLFSSNISVSFRTEVKSESWGQECQYWRHLGLWGSQGRVKYNQPWERKKQGIFAIDESKYPAKQAAHTWCQWEVEKCPQGAKHPWQGHTSTEIWLGTFSKYNLSEKTLDHRPNKQTKAFKNIFTLIIITHFQILLLYTYSHISHPKHNPLWPYSNKVVILVSTNIITNSD